MTATTTAFEQGWCEVADHAIADAGHGGDDREDGGHQPGPKGSESGHVGSGTNR